MARGKKRWDRSQYPDNWEEISYTFRASKDFTCEDCSTRQGDTLLSRAGRLYKAVVDAAHKWPNDTHNPDPDLLCLCKRCHRLYDNQFQDIIEEGQHQATLHGILLEQEQVETIDGRVYCSHPDCMDWYLPHEH